MEHCKMALTIRVRQAASHRRCDGHSEVDLTKEGVMYKLIVEKNPYTYEEERVEELELKIQLECDPQKRMLYRDALRGLRKRLRNEEENDYLLTQGESEACVRMAQSPSH